MLKAESGTARAHVGGSGEVTIPDLLSAVRRRWRLPAAGAAIGFAIMIAYGMVAQPYFRSELLAAPVYLDEEMGGQFGAIGGGSLSSLAKLAGAPTESTPQVEAMALMSSREFALDIVRQLKLAPLLFDDHWDADAGKWREKGSPSWLVRIRRFLFPVARSTPWRSSEAPTGDEIYEAYLDHTKFVIGDDGLLTISVEWKDPEVARRWAKALLREANDRMRIQAITRARASQGYLQRELQKTTLAELRNAITSLLELQLRRATLANTSPDYVFRVVDPASLPDEPYKPRVLLLCILGALLGAVGGIFRIATQLFAATVSE